MVQNCVQEKHEPVPLGVPSKGVLVGRVVISWVEHITDVPHVYDCCVWRLASRLLQLRPEKSSLCKSRIGLFLLTLRLAMQSIFARS